MKKAVIAMSGGVDSSVAALLMKQAGHDTMGVTMKLYVNEDIGIPREKTCCSLEDVEDARAVADKLSMPFYVLNLSESFEEQVINRFIEAYEHGRTPNPCIDCNRHIKFEKLMEKAESLGFEALVTGHYAIVEQDKNTGRYLLKKGVDEGKDQSYMLYSLTQNQLSKTVLPLGDMHKDDVRKIAEENGLINARKRDSQDICFVPDGDYAKFIENYSGMVFPEGDFVDSNGEVYGRHRGIIHYTIGQRRGLGLSFPQPMYVGGIDPVKNQVLLVKDQELFTKTLYAQDVNLISVTDLDSPMRVTAKVRYRHGAQPAQAVMTQQGLEVCFDEPQRAVTPGQAVVLYDGDTVVGGGTIKTGNSYSGS